MAGTGVIFQEVIVFFLSQGVDKVCTQCARWGAMGMHKAFLGASRSALEAGRCPLAVCAWHGNQAHCVATG